MKEYILLSVSDLVTSFTYYDRKEDEDLSVDQLNNAVKSGEVTIDEIVEKFRDELNNVFK